MTDLTSILDDITAKVERMEMDLHKRVRKIQKSAMETVRTIRDDIDEVASLPVNVRCTGPLTMRLRPIRVPAELYRHDWSNVYCAERLIPDGLASYLVVTSNDINSPDSDCIVSMLRADCIGLLLQRDVPKSNYPHRLWLWRDRLWRAVYHNSWFGLEEIRCWLRGDRKCI